MMAEQNPNSSPRVLIPRERLEARVSELAAEIERDYLRHAESLGEGAAPQPLLCIGVLKGSVFFMVDLLKEIEKMPVKVDFFQTSSYRDGTNPGEVRILKDAELAIRDRDVLLIEDIVDTGFTLSTILSLLEHRGARSVKLCALLDKREARKVDVPIDYCGFEIEDLFVVGYGLDLNDQYRNLPYIGVYEGDAQ